jgi:uncharacterized protein YciI
MHFIFISDYVPGMEKARDTNRTEHLAYWTQEKGQHMTNGGPLLDAAGKPYGAMFMLEAIDETQARTVYEGDPYVKAGVAKLKTVSAYRNAIRDGRKA